MKIHQKQIRLKERKRGFHLITSEIEAYLNEFTPTFNENKNQDYLLLHCEPLTMNYQLQTMN